jgi:hypothetical protein
MPQVDLPNHFFSIRPSKSALLHWLRYVISRKMLEEIAANDYSRQTSDHVSALERQLSDKPINGLSDWCPREVLELERWNEPEIATQPPTSDTSYQHRKRLLACTILLQSGGSIGRATNSEEEFFLDTSASTVIQLTRSTVFLGDKGPALALSFLLWLYETVRYPRLRPFIAFCAFLLWLEDDGAHNGCEAIRRTWQWVLEEELSYRQECPCEIVSERWLVGISSYENAATHRPRWLSTAKQILQKDTACSDETKKILSWIDLFSKS